MTTNINQLEGRELIAEVAKTMKLFTVTVTREMMVLAEDDWDARNIARQFLPDDIRDADEGDFEVEESKRLAKGWGAKCIPWGDSDEDRTVGEIDPTLM